MTQLASKLSADGPKCVQLQPLLATLEALLPTLDIPLRIFAHFYKLFVNNLAFLLKIDDKFRKIQKNTLKITKFSEKVLKIA